MHWVEALDQIHRALTPGGRIAFNMRNFVARGWEVWNKIDALQRIETEQGPAEVWYDVSAVGDEVVTYATPTRWLTTAKEEPFSDTLRFRDEAGLRATLAKPTSSPRGVGPRGSHPHIT